MDKNVEMLAHLQAALAIADRAGNHLIGAQLSLPIQTLAERIERRGPSAPPPRRPC